MIKGIKLLIAITMLSVLLAACGGDDNDKIKWQLPLTAPEDPHGGQSDKNPLPEWAAANKGTAKLMFLQTGTARAYDVEVVSDERKLFHDWDIYLLGMAKGLRIKNGTFIDDENVHNPAAFVELTLKGAPVYRGWIYQEFPELFGPDVPGWKLWLKGVTVRAPSQEGSNGLLQNRLP